MLSFMNIKRKGKYCKFHFDKEAWTKPKNVWSVRFKLEVFIWCHVVYVPKSLITFHGIFIWVIFRQRDMQEYILMFSICIRMEITVLFKWTVFAIYKLRRFPIHTCLFILCIASLGIFYKGVSWNSHFTNTDHNR